jgi:hypothetical protein
LNTSGFARDHGDERTIFSPKPISKSVLKQRIARQREAIKQAKLRGHATAPAEAAHQALEPRIGLTRASSRRRQSR